MFFALETWSESFITLGSILSEGRVLSALDKYLVQRARLVLMNIWGRLRRMVVRVANRHSLCFVITPFMSFFLLWPENCLETSSCLSGCAVIERNCRKSCCAPPLMFSTKSRV